MSAQIAAMLMMIAASVQIGNAAMNANCTIVFSMSMKNAEGPRPRLQREDPEPDEELDDSEDEEERAPRREVGEEQSALRHREVVVLQERDEALQDVQRADDDEKRAGERVPPARELTRGRAVVLSLRRHLSLL